MIWHLWIYLLAATIDPSFMDIFINFYKYSDIYRYINCFFLGDLAFIYLFISFYK